MSKQATLATCIAKMYEGAKLDNARAASERPKKVSPKLLGTVEEKLSLLEGRVDQVVSMQTAMFQKLDSVCQGLGALDQSLAQLRQDVLGQHTVKSTHEDTGQGRDDPAVCTEVRALCSEMVTLLKSQQREGQLQSKELEHTDNSVSRLEKAFGHMEDTFRSSKIMEFILSGMVLWKKQGLLDVVEEEEINCSDECTGKGKAVWCHKGTQTPGEINDEATAVLLEHQEEIITCSAPGHLTLAGPGEAMRPPGVGDVAAGKSQRRVKEVTLKSREPGQAQAFDPQSQHEPKMTQFQEVPPSVIITMTTASQPERVSEHTEDPGAREQPSSGSLESQKQDRVEEQRKKMEREDEMASQESGEHSQREVPQETWLSKQNMPFKKNVESGMWQQESGALATSQSRGTKQEPVSRLVAQETKSADLVLEKHVLFHKDPEPFSDGGTESPALCNGTKPKAASLSKGSSSHLLIIDDCPPQPAPFEHRIVSAKQVPIESYYTVQPTEVLGGGRFGQVHKCAELSSGITLAAKIIKVKGMKEREEVKNEIGIMNQINHVNLIQLYDAFESRTNLVLIMEYVEGGELFNRIVDEHFQLTELDAIVFMRQICEGVQYLHQQYILHLDLKPENILCVGSTGNQIKIIDFGLARKYRPREKLKVNFGTPEFLAPEVVNYDFVSFPTDMWSVGVITYMLLSGLSPFLGETETETMNHILRVNWDFDAEAFENVSEEAKNFISRLLQPAKCSRLSAAGCMKHSWLNNLEDKAKRCRVRLRSHLKLQCYLAAQRQWKKHFYAVAAANRLKLFQQSRSMSTP
ncbi:myosin light chain kinase 3 [Electrophorus electricus]|uniref:myosin light chain kinase 3 n=1 Tax=Electrophorus electricus TaxID=8005 RepID=UPI0015D05698|nr:myosin light chain kinase 3 [Electrophorus electricus]